MIWTIAKKEFREKILTPYFITGLLLCLFLIPFTIITGIKTFESQMGQYEKDLNTARREMEKTQVYGQLQPVLTKKPTALSIFSKGISEQVGNTVQIKINEKPMFARSITSMHQNPFLVTFLSLDFISILVIVLSLLGILFSYNLFSKEKELGTLRLALSNSISRATFFSGKILGIYLTLMPILIICFMIVWVIILVSPAIQLTMNDYVRLSFLFILSLVYFSFFVLLGSYISSRLKKSSTSIIINLFIWIFLVFIYPNMMSQFGKNIHPVKDYGEVRNQISSIEQDFWGEMDEVNDQVKSEGLERNGWNICSGWNYGPLQIYWTPRSTMEYERRLHEITAPKVLDYTSRKWMQQQAYLNELYRQQKFLTYIRCLSPSEIFKHLGGTMCKTDINAQVHFMNQTRLYHDQFFTYMKENRIFSSYTYFTAQKEEDFPENWEKANAGYQNWRNSANPESTFDLSSFGYLDTSDIPKFEYKEKNVFEGLMNQIGLIATILILCALLYWFTFRSFLKYDIR